MLAGQAMTRDAGRRAGASRGRARAEGEDMLERVVQVSRAAAGLRQEDVYRIIRTAHAANTLAGISGGLIFLDGWFAHVLEGTPGPAFDACLTRVACDPRHRDLERRSRERALCRLFPGQAMALRTRACLDPGLIEGFGWRPGFPVEGFPADVLVEFVVRACHRTPPAPRAMRAIRLRAVS
jgi:hypothetical protein